MFANAPAARLAIGWLTMFVIGTDLFVISPLLPLIAADYQASAALAGLGVAVFALSYMISAPLLGHLADRIGRRRMLTCCLFGFALANLLTGAAANLALLLLARLFAGAAAAGVSPSLYALVSGLAPPDRRATWLALVVSGLLVSLLLGAPIGGLAGVSFGWPTIFRSLAGLSLLLAWANRWIWPVDYATGKTAAEHHPWAISVLSSRLAPMVAWSAAVYCVYIYLGAGLAACGFSTGEIAAIIMLYGCGAIGGILIGGRMVDQLGAKLTSSVGLGGLCVCLLVVQFAIDAGMLVAFALALASAAAQLFFPAQQASLADDFPDRRHCARLEQQRPFSRHLARISCWRTGHLARRLRCKSENCGGNRHCRLDDQSSRHAEPSAFSGRGDGPAVKRVNTHSAAPTSSIKPWVAGKVIVTVVPNERRLSIARLPP